MSAELELRTAREIEDIRRAFKADRVGHNGKSFRAGMKPQRITYLAHGNGWVMARHPGCQPFAITEELWRSFPLWRAPAAITDS